MNSSKQYDIYERKSFGLYEEGKFLKIMKNLKCKENAKIIDLAGGEGHFYDILSKYDKSYDYTLVDFSDKQIQKGRKKNIKVKNMDLSEKFNLNDKSYDVVLASEIIEHIFDTRFFLSECYRILADREVFVLTTPNVASIGNRIGLLFGNRPGCIDFRVEKSSGHIRAFVRHELYSLFEEVGFKIIKFTGQRINLPFLNRRKRYYAINYHLGDFFPAMAVGFMVFATKT